MTDTTVTVNLPNGVLTIDATALTSAITSVLHANATFTPNATPAPTPTPTPISKRAALMSYLASLKTAATKHCLIGQTEAIWDKPLTDVTVANAPIAAVKTATGKQVAIAALIANFATNSWAVDPTATLQLAAQLQAQGTILHVSAYWNMPTIGNGGAAPTASPLDANDFHQITVAGSPQNVNFLAQIDNSLLPWLQKLEAAGLPYFFRPFIEINGNWNWYGAQNASDFIAVWKIVYNRVAPKCSNAIWVYNVNQDVGNYTAYFPGSAYAHVASIDLYADNGSSSNAAPFVAKANDGGAYAALSALNIPLIASEVGLGTTSNGTVVGPGNNTQDMTVIVNGLKQLPNIVAAILFNGPFAIASQKNAAALMSDPYIVTAADLPATI